MFGLRHGEILQLLNTLVRSMCTLRQTLKSLHRRQKASEALEVASFFNDQLLDGRRLQGYKLHHLRGVHAAYVCTILLKLYILFVNVAHKSDQTLVFLAPLF